MQQLPQEHDWPSQIQPQPGFQPSTGNDQPPSPYPAQQGQFRQPYTPHAQQNQQLNQPQPPPERKHVSKRILFAVGLIAACVLFAGAVGFALLGRGTSSSTSPSTLPEPQYKASTTDTTVAHIAKDGNKDKGMNVHFTGTMLNFVRDSHGKINGANVGTFSPAGIIQVIFPTGTDVRKLKTGDTLEVWGMDEGVFKFGKLSGKLLLEVRIAAVNLIDKTTAYHTASR